MRQMMIYIKVVLIACLLIFIGGILISDKDSKKNVEEMEEAILPIMDVQSMVKGQPRDVRRVFGLNSEDYEGIVYYKPMSTMDVKETLIVKMKSSQQAETVKQAIQARVDAQLQSFQGYGAQQCALLENAEIKVVGNYVFYAVADNVSQLKKTFLDNL